jgi:hypothetical protein
MVMTASQLFDGRILIPGAFELNAPPHRANQATDRAATASAEEVRRVPPANAANVVAAPVLPTSRLGYAAAILWDLALVLAIIYGVAVLPALAVWGIKAASTFIVTFGGP